MNWRQAIVAGLAALVLAGATAAMTTMRDIAHADEQLSAAGPFLLAASPAANAVAFSPDGTLLASAYANGTVRFQDPATGQPTGPVLHDTAGNANAVAFSPDGKLLASAYANGTIRLWNPTTGQLLRSTDTRASANAVAFSPDGELLASAYANGTIRLWNPTTGKLHGAVLPGADVRASADAVAFSLDGELLAGAYANGTVRLWNPATGQIASAPLRIGSGRVSGVAFSPNGRLLASACGDAVLIWGRAAQPGSHDDVSWLSILAFVIAIAVSALAVIITARARSAGRRRYMGSPRRRLWRS